MNHSRVILRTNYGDITLELTDDLTPRTVENFLGLIRKWYYDGVIFHRVIRDFMIQWGDPTGTGRGGESIFGEKFDDEFHPTLKHDKGVISMANAGPNTNGSQFFIVHAQNTHYLDGRHSVFGRVVEGMEVVEDIANVPVDRSDRPMSDVVIERAVVVGDEV
jgi:cyclophilin family peptidyl-prolyl cis-trans isomerase